MGDIARSSIAGGGASAADQVDTVAALLVIVNEAARRNLPPITWRIGRLGSTLVANADQYAAKGTTEHDPAATRELRCAVFDQYVDLLRWLRDDGSVEQSGPSRDLFPTELIVQPPQAISGGVVRLSANLKHVTVPLTANTRKWLLNVMVIAEFETDPER